MSFLLLEAGIPDKVDRVLHHSEHVFLPLLKAVPLNNRATRFIANYFHSDHHSCTGFEVLSC